MARARKGVVTMDTPGVKVIHTMADGSVRDSVENYLTDYNKQLPPLAKRLLIQFIENGAGERRLEKRCEQTDGKVFCLVLQARP